MFVFYKTLINDAWKCVELAKNSLAQEMTAQIAVILPRFLPWH